MLRLKEKRLKKEAEEKAAKEAAEKAAKEEGESAGAGAGGGAAGEGASSDAAPEKKKITGITGVGGGRRGTPGSTTGGRVMTSSQLRVMKDVADLDTGDIADLTWVDKSDICRMTLTVRPDQGFWKGATFVFTLNAPDAYPYSPPKVHCETKVYHPNIDLEGHVCLNILRDEWKPVFTINTVVYGVIYLFYEPNPNDPLNLDAAALFRRDIDAFKRNVVRSLSGGSVDGVSFPRLL